MKNPLQPPRFSLSTRQMKLGDAKARAPILASTIHWGGRRVKLTPLETRLYAVVKHGRGDLVTLSRARAFTYEGREVPASRSAFDVLLHGLRKKVPGAIVSDPGGGFRWKAHDPWAKVPKSG